MPKIGAVADPALVLGSYPDAEAGRLALRTVRSSGFRRAAAIYALPGGRSRVEDNALPPLFGAFGGALCALALVIGYILLSARTGVPREAVEWLAVAAIVAGGTVTGWLVSRRLDLGLADSTLARYRRWLTVGETLVIVEVEIGQARAVLSLLRGAEDVLPATFIIRPHREVPGRVAELQRRERFTGERFKVHATWLANRHAGALRGRRPLPLWNRLRDGERIIDAITSDLAQAVQLEQSISVSAEWLLDNAYVIQRQIADVRRNLSHQLYNGLPMLEAGPHQGEPRAFDLASEIVAHTDAELGEEDVVNFLIAYQRVTPLDMSELWALPLLLRLALLERLSYLATRIDAQQHEFEWADFWANRLLAVARRAPEGLLFTLAELAREHPDPSTVFADRLIGQLQGESLALGPVLGWLELKWGQPVLEAIRLDERRHAADQATIASGITSLRLLGRLDWRDVFESVSVVEEVLRAEPAGIYSQMDFGTRDRYRHVVEQVARRSRATELETATAAVHLSSAGDGHVGYHLIDSGRALLEARVGYRSTVRQQLSRSILRRLSLGYLCAIALGTALVLLIPALFIVLFDLGWASVAGFAALCLLALVPASELVVQVVNFSLARILRPQPLPKLAFKTGVPDEWRTLVVVPTLLVSARSIQDDLDNLEVRSLADRDANLRFALLADLVDAAEREVPDDAALLRAAVRGVEQLNSRYPGNRFSLFCRPRRWSATERCWMGWERKRGKLEELNAWLLGEDDPLADTLRPIAGDPSQLQGVRLVITLDADTQLPHGTARRLIGTLAHPLNRPRLAPDGRRVVGGYAIIQPRVSPSLPSATATRFSRIFADPVGVDPYSQVASVHYQDHAGEGTYYGKGIYDVAAFHRVLGGRFPQETLLSHDLLEGAYVRVGMATDIELFDSYPGSYYGENQRQHRWLRGDWQIAAWCGASVPTAGSKREPNPLGVLNRWKLLDNLRRSLIPATSVGLLVVSWLFFPGLAALASLLVGLGLLLPAALRLIVWVPSQPLAVLTSGRAWRDQGAVWLRALLAVALLPHQAALALDAITRTLARGHLSHRHLLQWQSYQTASQGGVAGERRLLWQLVLVGLFSVGLSAATLTINPGAAPAAAPFLLLWLLSPAAIAWVGAARGPRPEQTFADADRLMLRGIARMTWRYFDDFVGPETSWLPPDNYQEVPREELAERTSPTNVGLWLLAVLAARDFGYITPDQAVERGQATLDALDRLERFEGHFLNWYDTRTLEPLLPRYVSTVDSGNLLASLWTLAHGYREMSSRPPLGAEALRGLADTLALVRLPEAAAADHSRGPAAAGLGKVVGNLSRLCANPPGQREAIVERLRAAVDPARELAQTLRARVTTVPGQAAAGEEAEAAYWATQFERQLASWLDTADRYGGLNELSGQQAQFPSQAAEFVARLEPLIARVEGLAAAMNMRFLYDTKRRLFTVGYNVGERRFDSSYYDLLASEARLASLVAIARGDVPAEHWFALGRHFGTAQGHRVLFSWSGTMFEYLMPLLFTRSYRHTMLDEACRDAVALHIDYGQQQKVPWGVSESAYAAVDANQIYQYQAFGVPGLGLKRGLADDLVVAPYASALALMVEPESGLANLKRLAQLGLRGNYGYYEAIDFTRRRQPKGGHGAIVHNYMVHHQGMTLLALDNVLQAGVMSGRFHADLRVQAVEPLLFEQTPLAPVLVKATERGGAPARLLTAAPAEPTVPLDALAPATHLLGNGTYSVLVSSAGGGHSRWRDADVTRWRADTTLDRHGSFYYVKDVESGAIWSATHQPIKRVSDRYLARFTADRAEFERRDFGIGTATKIAVSPEDPVEIRQLTLTNHSSRRRRLEVTSYVELALAPHGADLAHPAFAKLFVETEALPELDILLAWRKPRSADDGAIWAAHALVLPTVSVGAIATKGCETDRARFVGQGRDLENPQALEAELSCSAGPVLDPIFSLRCELTLDPGQQIELAFVTAAAENRESVLNVAEKHRTLHAVHRTFEMAFNRGQSIARQLGVTAVELRRFQQLAGPLLYPSARLRASERQLRRNRLGQAGLWNHGISGDLPIILVSIGDRRDMEVVREALVAHAYWRLLGFRADLVMINEEAGGYEQPLQGDLRRVIQRHAPHTPLGQPGGIFLLPAEKLAEDQLTLLFATARVVVVAARGPLVQQLGMPSDVTQLPPPLVVGRRASEEPSAPLPFMELPYFNGIGGFTPDGREYAIYLGPGTRTPAPWANVLANPEFGALVSESGSGFAWAANSQANRLTPWSNDPVSDPPGEAIYIR
ncbi:MAG: glucoamylase family protein, partial [Chloroflexota bacterium]